MQFALSEMPAGTVSLEKRRELAWNAYMRENPSKYNSYEDETKKSL